MEFFNEVISIDIGDNTEMEIKNYFLIYRNCLAEKFEMIISRSIINTRMKGVYDIYILYKLRSKRLIIKF